MPAYYEIKIRDHLDQCWSDWFAGLSLTHLEEDLLLGIAAGCANPGRNVLTDNLAEPLNGATTAKFDINPGDGNLTIDRLTGGEPLLAGGDLQYLENQGQPTRTMISFLGETALTLRGGTAGQPWFRLPWADCNGATEWRIHLNPTVLSDITAHTNGGNVKLDLTGMAVTRVSADTSGGNMDVILPDDAANLSVMAKTGAGDVTVEIGDGMTGSNTVNAESGAGDVVVHIPSDVAARIHVTAGMGKVTVVPQFSKNADDTYQSSDFDTAADTVEITLSSGAGNVSVDIK
jgi:predicted membrane protein